MTMIQLVYISVQTDFQFNSTHSDYIVNSTYWFQELLNFSNDFIKTKSGSRYFVSSKMEFFVKIVNGQKPFTIFTNSSILGVAASENCNIVTDNRDSSVFQVTPSKLRLIFLQKFQVVILRAGQVFKRISNDGFIFRRKLYDSAYMVIIRIGGLFK